MMAGNWPGKVVLWAGVGFVGTKEMDAGSVSSAPTYSVPNVARLGIGWGWFASMMAVKLFGSICIMGNVAIAEFRSVAAGNVLNAEPYSAQRAAKKDKMLELYASMIDLPLLGIKILMENVQHAVMKERDVGYVLNAELNSALNVGKKVDVSN